MRGSEQLKILKRRLLGLKRTEALLQQERNGLQYQEALLISLCQCFSVLEVNQQAHSLISSQAAANSGEHLQQLQAALLKELALSPPGVFEAHGDLLSPLEQQELFQAPSLKQDPNVQRIAPRQTPLSYFMHLVTQPALQEAATMTAKDLATCARDAVLRSSLELQRLQLQCQPPDRQMLGLLWERHHVLMMSALLHGRPELVAQLNTYNLSTLTDMPDALPSNIARQATIPTVLGLAEQQLQDIAVGSALFSRLMQNILDEQRQLHAECDSSTSSTSTSSEASFAAVESIDSLHQDWEARQHSTRSMEVLLHKEYAMRGAWAAWFAGCLTWEQYTQTHICAWPFVLGLPALCSAIARHYEAQQKQ